MKKIVLPLLLLITLAACSTDSEESYNVLTTVEDVTMPERYKVDSISNILVKYKRPTDCDLFNGFYYAAEGQNRTVAIQVLRMRQQNCEADNTIYEVPLAFKPKAPGTYLFKFWNATDGSGVEQYIEREVVVPE